MDVAGRDDYVKPSSARPRYMRDQKWSSQKFVSGFLWVPVNLVFFRWSDIIQNAQWDFAK